MVEFEKLRIKMDTRTTQNRRMNTDFRELRCAFARITRISQLLYITVYNKKTV